MNTNNEWLSPTDLADELGVPTQSVYAWRYKGTGPKAYKIGRHLRFRRSEVEAWLATRAEPQEAA